MLSSVKDRKMKRLILTYMKDEKKNENMNEDNLKDFILTS